MLAVSRQVEHHCRMLANQQWDVWSDTLEKFIDINSLFSDDERLWKQRPVFNLLTYWWMLTQARLTENPPILTFQPSTADRKDAQLAETFDTVFKSLWADTHMPETVDRLMGWIVACGTGYLKSYPTYDDAENAQPRVGPATASLDDPQTGEAVDYDLSEPVPYSAAGEPQFALLPHPDTGDMVAMPTAEPEMEPGGGLEVCELNPLQVRGEWNQKPWHEKAWHQHKDYFTPSVIEQRWGIAVEADVSMTGDGNGPGYLERLMFNAGHYDAIRGQQGVVGNGQFGLGTAATDGYAAVYELWEKPSADNGQHGRLLVVTKTAVLYDGPRPFPKLKGASPIRRFQFVGIPGRPSGSTPMEFLVPLQQAYNRSWAQQLEHAALMTNPMILVDDAAGLDEEQFESIPGMFIRGGLSNGVPMLQRFEMPALSADFYHTRDGIRDEFMFLGNMMGTEGTAPTQDASGELVQQLRANADRFIGPTARGLVNEIGRLADDWLAILEVIWTTPKLITWAGDDKVPQTLAVEPDLWQGNVNVVPDVESMLPEGRGEKQARVFQLWQAGWYGDPLNPATTAKVAPLLRFPNMNRAAQPGGVDGVTASQNLGALLLGTPPQGIPLFDAYDFAVHLDVTNQYIKSPEFKQCDPAIQGAIQLHAQQIEQRAALKLVQDAQKAAAVQSATMQASLPAMAAAHGAAQAHGLLPPPGADPASDSQPATPPSPASERRPTSVPPAPLRAAS